MITADILYKLIEKYGSDEERLLQEMPGEERLYAFSNQTVGILDILSLEKGQRILLVGGYHIAIIEYLLEQNIEVCIWEEDMMYAKALKLRFEKNFSFFTMEEINRSAGEFDYILLRGLEDDRSYYIYEHIDFFISKGAKVLLAVENRYGISYLLGAKQEHRTYTREQIQIYLREKGIAIYQFYYPYPDYHLPLEIYSDIYLPKKEDLKKEFKAYNYPRLGSKSVGEALVDVYTEIENFMSSYLVLIGDKSKTAYIKYNRNRKEEYRIRTVIRESEDGFSVEKEALLPEGKEHILSFEKKYAILSDENPNVHYIQAHITGRKAVFPYIQGESLLEYVGGCIKNGYVEKATLEAYLEKIIPRSGTGNVDAVFDNFMIDADTEKIYGLDYEWVSDHVLERKYSYFRALSGFYRRYQADLKMDEDTFFALFDIKAEDRKRFADEERDFQEGIHGNIQRIYLDNYFVDYYDEKRLTSEIERYRYLESVYQNALAELRERKAGFLEDRKLSDNHIRNLESMISALRLENEELWKANAHLIRINFPYRLKRKLKALWQRFRQPTDSVKIEEKARAVLEFPIFDNPRVSIVIPVYNQIDYTYACLQSVLEHTDIPYEVILADDVSEDDTKHIAEFVKNIKVIRNETNTGFLLNCNHAAGYARGEYIFFLNNDTQVKQGYLNALVELMDRDESVGMTGSKLVYPDGRLQEAGGIIWSDGSGWNYGRLDDAGKCEYNYVKEVDYISGAAILVRRSLWEEIGGFDTRFVPAYCEDADLAFEIRKRGKKVVYQPKSEVIHFEGISNGTDIHGSGLKRYQVENSIKLREKWAEEFQKQYDNIGMPDPFRARERSRDKKIILFIDHYVPTFDKDAGSKATYQYLKMLVKKGFIVKFIGDNFANEEPYTSALENLGIEVLYGAYMRDHIFDWIRKYKDEIHLVYMNRPHISIKYIDFFKMETDIKVIYFGHDLHFLREEREYALHKNEENKKNSEYYKAMEFHILRKADMNYYPSCVEVDYLHLYDESLPLRAITLYVYEEFCKTFKNIKETEDILFVGGFRHKPNKDALHYFLEEIWDRVREVLNIRLYIVGSGADEELISYCNTKENVIFKGFVSDEMLEDLYFNARMVIAPLRYGAGVKGKILEALYYGKPVLTTSIGAEGIQRADETMLIEDSAEGFIEALIGAYDNISLLEHLQENAKAYIKEYHSIDAVWKIIEGDFTDGR